MAWKTDAIAFARYQILHLGLLAGDKVVARGTSVSDQRVKVALRVKDDPVRTRRSARVDLVCGQDRELVPRAGCWEAEALVVVVLVRVATCKFIVSNLVLQELGFSYYEIHVIPGALPDL